MLSPDTGSTNTDPPTLSASDKIPLVGEGLYRRISGFFSCQDGQRNNSQGYIEFGSMTEQSETRTLGMFAGVFSPVTLSMFSALIFLRVGYIVGNAGLLVTLLQFLIAYSILLFTVASVCAVSTNGAVEGGGAYFMISRTLGPDFGGSIGTLFFLANVVSSALCISGCAEGLVENFGPSGYLIGENAALIPDSKWYRFLYCTALNTLNLLVCLIGAGMFAKTSVVILATVIFCLGTTIISFFVEKAKEVVIPDANQLVQNATYHVFGNYTGLMGSTIRENLWSNYGKDYTSHGQPVDFASVFGVLFSGVTGIMAGANMSGELKQPARSIPRGTLSAVAFTFIIYITVSVLTAATCTQYLLQNNYLYMIAVNVWPVCVAIGLLTSTFSASLSNLIGGSRVLEALAKDQVFGSALNFITKGTWHGNPIMAVVVSWVLVQLILLIGSLNVIAQLNSVLFLLSYLATNMACLGLELASAPNFRPTFKYFSWHTALIGLVGTLVMMFVINSVYAACSIVLCLVLVIFLHLFSPAKEEQWGSISQALIFHQVRKYLLMLDSRKDHVKFWRPQVLFLVSNPRTCCPLIDFINDLKKGGLYVLGHVKIGNPLDSCPDPTIVEYPHWLSLVDHLRVKAFIELTVAGSIREGLQHLVRISGMGAMKPNTIVLGFHDTQSGYDFFQGDTPYRTDIFETDSGLFTIRNNQKSDITSKEYVSMIGDVLRMNKNICLCRNFSKLEKKTVSRNTKIKYIDVWPINFLEPSEQDAFDTTSLFMMQLACIVNMVPAWKRMKLRICLCEETSTSNRFIVSEGSNGSENRGAEYKLRQLLQMLRITANIFQIPLWSDVIDGLGGRSVAYKLNSIDNDDVNTPYIESVNELIKRHSDSTALTFIYLPAPPNVSEADMSMVYPQYLKMLSGVTESLPPTILVHGISTVTSTSL